MDKETKTFKQYNYNDSFSINEDINTDYQIRLNCIGIAERYSKTVMGTLNNAELVYKFLFKKIKL